MVTRRHLDDPSSTPHTDKSSILFQSAKLGDVDQILRELDWAKVRLGDMETIDRIYGVSGGALSALAFAIAVTASRSSKLNPKAHHVIDDLSSFLRHARSHNLRRLNWNPWYGLYSLIPLRRELTRLLVSYGLGSDTLISSLPIALYLCVGDRDGTFTLFGPPNADLQFEYTWIRVGPPKDAPLLDALIAAVSTSLSTEPGFVNDSFYRDCRPAINDAQAILADLEAKSPRPIWAKPPHTPPPQWKLNWITSSFIMHRHHEHNQAVLARYYIDLHQRHQQLTHRMNELEEGQGSGAGKSEKTQAAQLTHIDLPYIGSTEAFTNMRQSVAQKELLMQQFQSLLEGQFDKVRFDQRTNVIYGAGGFSGILGGLVTTRQVEEGFQRAGGSVEQIYGVSAGVLNGFFHAVQVAAERHPDLYTPAARLALTDLERFFERISPRMIGRINLHPKRFWQGWANLDPLKRFLSDRLAAYTGSSEPEMITFDDIQLPLTIAVARNDGFTDFLGMTTPSRQMHFGGTEIVVLSAPVIQAIIAGWSMNTYIHPTQIGDQTYRDGGGSFYDPALFVACLDPELINLLNIHLDEPEGHSYNLPARPNLLRLLFDTHNYNFPEERRRMRLISNLLFDHYALRTRAASAGVDLAPDFRQRWMMKNPAPERVLTQTYTA